jgi:coproporphyrinogen III oxidase-like Fe-S oxidoreductase
MKGEQFCYSDMALTPYSLMGIGPTAISRIWGRLAYKAKKNTGSRFDPELEIYTGSRIGVRKEMIRFILICLREEFSCSIPLFKSIFGIDMREPFKVQLDYLLEKNILEIRDRHILLKSDDRKDLVFSGLILASSGHE